jgi:opacity protein-like surface antigen
MRTRAAFPHAAPFALLGAIALLGVASTPAARADLSPEVITAVGATGAVAGSPSGGGASFALSLLWPLEDGFRAGVMGFADDLGQRTGRLVAGGTDLGPVQTLHRQASGVAWRIEGRLPGARYQPIAAITWGLYHFTDDVRGNRLSARTAAGLGLGLGVARRISDRHAVAAMLRYQQLSRGAADRYMSGAVEWRWGSGDGR